ncbi:MlaD family protein [Methylocystis sp. SC2]|uniref:MlaD family protein n=1 Tax=Methylocystis sp. (strain SC2) TaxID=187303 RepID=UPI00027AE775|nr:MlaD family protein [Methylocystis sp. SC2]CCJ07899.1 ABC-type transport system protein [Methylocystis sp. SC2]
METRANYALIGAFTLAVAFAAFLFVYWFSGPSQLGRQETFQIVFTAVSGLTRGSSVLFNGVKVGEVTHLGISEQDPSKVDVLVRIDSRTPVKTDTRARLETRGFTGVSDVLLVGGTPGAPALTAQVGQKYPQIQAERSEIQNLLVNVQSLSTKAAELLTKLDKLIDDNGPAITATLKNAETVSKTLADNSASITSFIRDASDIARSMKPAAARLDQLLAAGEKTIKAIDPKQIKAITGNIAGASERINRFAATGLREYEQLAVDGRKAVDSFDRTLRSVEKNPSQFIFGPSQSVPEYQGR